MLLLSHTLFGMGLSDFIMTPNGKFSTSQFTALLFIIVGALGVILVHINHYVLKKKGLDLVSSVSKYAGWFDSLSHKTKIILLAIPVTGWVNASLYRFSKDHFNAGIVSLILGPIFWIMDLVFYLTKGTLSIWSNELVIENHQIIENSLEEEKNNE